MVKRIDIKKMDHIIHKIIPTCICYAQTMDRDNPWIALLKVWIRALRGQSMHLRDPWIAQPASSVRAKEEEREPIVLHLKSMASKCWRTV